ncbi:proline racemase [Punctularia strigosozonata HHB-11173 SS5]|uniref:proline racemase n=1 Tax=Punctularia strigosozonata (strain HHB-11173) TaxID=741275 RepID=UPI000441849E|nr:proline racemase [Punctularia strigosozonata HHB-11173 SS5]EIN11335.1 proline racemase [Punctularia strigosozonata HHB-11173 SS5]
MDIWRLDGSAPVVQLIKTVDMHTTGEPTRIIVAGYPPLEGETLLQKRACAKTKYDHIRRQLMHEPRGHRDMYGAILLPETEMTALNRAHIGVLFCHNEGYSTMCGHATLALGRFLVDTRDRDLFPRRDKLVYDELTRTTEVVLHAPCGPLKITVPTISEGGRLRSDAARPVSFHGVPSYVTGMRVDVPIPEDRRWSHLRSTKSSVVQVDVAYGGAFYGIVSTEELGFTAGLNKEYTLEQFDKATSVLKSCLMERRDLFKHPTEPDLEFLYGIIVVDRNRGKRSNEDAVGANTGLCFFADREIDRSPTGSGVMARTALAVSRGELEVGDSWEYHSIVSAGRGEGGFRGTVISSGPDGVVARVEGKAYYTGTHSFVVEACDPLADGFVLGL